MKLLIDTNEEAFKGLMECELDQVMDKLIDENMEALRELAK